MAVESLPPLLSEPVEASDAVQAILETLEAQYHDEDNTVPDPATWVPVDDWRIMPARPTPFSWSVLAPALNTAYAGVTDEMGLPPEADFLRLWQGRAYRRRHPLFDDGALPVDRGSLPNARGGLLGSLLAGRRGEKDLETSTRRALDRVTAWYNRVRQTHWGQAELLQVMEEIERIGAALLAADQGVRLTWRSAVAQIIQVQADVWPEALPGQIAAFAHAGLTYDMALQRLREAAVSAAELPGFLEAYGARGPLETELAAPRWQQDPSRHAPDVNDAQTGLAEEADAVRQAAERTLSERVGLLRRRSLQALFAARSQAVDLWNETDMGRALWLAGTRIWALAAAAEATADKRLVSRDDIFFLELEEVKQLMTGEWNITHQASLANLVCRRRERYTV